MRLLAESCIAGSALSWACEPMHCSILRTGVGDELVNRSHEAKGSLRQDIFSGHLYTNDANCSAMLHIALLRSEMLE
jgi:hypothetical protein